MKTASFFTFKGAGRISIARFPPRGAPPGFRVYKKLAPGPWFNSVSRAEYEVLFAEQLALLKPAEVAADLENLSGDAEPVLLCYEKPPFSEANWCHRRIVARWFLETMGMKVREVISREQLEAAVLRVGLWAEGTARPFAECTDAELVSQLPREELESLGLQ